MKNFINKPNLGKEISKILVPNQYIRKAIARHIENLNQKKIINKSLNDDFKAMLVEKYFISDIKELEQIIGRDLSIWYSDSIT